MPCCRFHWCGPLLSGKMPGTLPRHEQPSKGRSKPLDLSSRHHGASCTKSKQLTITVAKASFVPVGRRHWRILAKSRCGNLAFKVTCARPPAASLGRPRAGQNQALLAPAAASVTCPARKSWCIQVHASYWEGSSCRICAALVLRCTD